MKMRREAAIIEHVFAEHGVACRVLPPPASFQTAAMRVYRLARGNGITVSKVLGLADELDEALTAVRGQEVRCRFDRLPHALEVPLANPQPLPVAKPLQTLHRLRNQLHLAERLLGVVGEANSYNQAETMLLDLVNPNSPHALIAGTTGSGKTNLLITLIASMTLFHSPDEVALVLLDPKGIDLVGFNGLPHLACPVVTEPAPSVEVLAQIVAELERRKRQGYQHPRIVVFIDELAELADVAGAQVEANVKRLLQVGRGLGVHVIGATQKPLAAVIGSLVKANFPVRIIGKVASQDDARVAAGIAGTGAERLPGRGAMLLLRGGELKRLQAYHLPKGQIPVHVTQMKRLWRDTPERKWHLPAPQAGRMPVGIEPSSAQPRYPEWLRELVVQYIAEQGRAPSQKAVQRAYQKETGQMLNWEGVKAAISDAEAQKGDHSSASKDATQP
jgi:S-DNA-T family DNA segregation ATPase FtsK/SpoIIIE